MYCLAVATMVSPMEPLGVLPPPLLPPSDFVVVTYVLLT